MGKKLSVLKKIKEYVNRKNQPKQHYYTIREKKEMALRGEDIPLCVYSSDKIKTKSITSIRHVPNSELKNLNMKL